MPRLPHFVLVLRPLRYPPDSVDVVFATLKYLARTTICIVPLYLAIRVMYFAHPTLPPIPTLIHHLSRFCYRQLPQFHD